ncbi:hypothetical protein E4U32_002263 [Claviceps aff. humidiphila group G2b]|nr:hypothetical protein E4U32_002263 [Claviceps aff. humidiphila group G2b]
MASPPPTTTTVTQESPSRASQPQSSLRRISSITQLFRGHSRSTSTTAVPEFSWPAHDHDDKGRARRHSSFYVPTHAAASFARTVSPLSPVRIEAKIEEDDLEQLSSSSGKKTKHRSHRRSHHHTTTPEHKTQSVPNISSHPATAGVSPTSSRKASRHGCAPSRQQQQQQRQQEQKEELQQHEHQTEYAAFLAEAEASERARLAQRRRKCVSMPSRAPSTSLHASSKTAAAAAAIAIMRGSPSPMATTKTTPAMLSYPHRDSAYYSNASRSSASGGGGGGAAGGIAGAGAGAAAMDHNLRGRLPTVGQPKTLGRRLSEYVKPPRQEVCV